MVPWPGCNDRTYTGSAAPSMSKYVSLILGAMVVMVVVVEVEDSMGEGRAPQSVVQDKNRTRTLAKVAVACWTRFIL